MLAQDPQLVAAAVATFHYRDVDDMKAAARVQHFPPQVGQAHFVVLPLLHSGCGQAAAYVCSGQPSLPGLILQCYCIGCCSKDEHAGNST